MVTSCLSRVRGTCLQCLLVMGLSAVLLCNSVSAEPVFYGVGFSPYMNGQSPPDEILSGQIRSRLSIVAPYVGWIRDWGSASGLEQIPSIGREFGLKVAQCAFLNKAADNNVIQKNHLIEAAAQGYVDVAIVGTESLVSGDVTEPDLVSHLQDVRHRLDDLGLSSVPVATAEPYGTWANGQPGGLFRRNPDGTLVHAQVLQNLDQLFVHLYPYHEGVSIDAAQQKLADMYDEVSALAHSVAPDLKIVIGETGWPSAGNTNVLAVPSLENEERYFSEVVDWSNARAISTFWMEAFDENWKPEGYAGVERHWGLFNADGTGKFAVPEPGPLAHFAASSVVLLFVARLRKRHRRN
jgi:exo-beta-1,3-glucanase (GH17 family)